MNNFPDKAFSAPSNPAGLPSLQVVAPPVVLVVDDDEDNLQLACFIVEQAGYSTITASSGREALMQMQKPNVRLVLLDIRLSDMSGFEVIQQHPNLAVPVIAVSALATEVEQIRMLEAGFSAFLCKPYEIDDLEAVLRHYCPAEVPAFSSIAC